jgi:transposase
MPQLSIAQKSSIVILLKEGWTERRVADRFQVPKSTVHYVKVRWNQRHSLERQVGTGRQKLSTKEEDNNLIQFLENNPFKIAVEARQMTQFPASARTARRRIRTASNLRNRAGAKNPFLTQANKQERVGFALQHYMQDINFWENVVFTDEKVFQSFYNGHVRVYKPSDTGFEEQYKYTKCRKQ